MTPQRFAEIDRLVSLALEREPDERATFVEQTCGADAELFQEVETLLKCHEQPGSFLAEPPISLLGEFSTQETGEVDAQINARIGRRIGPYRLLAEIGHGGMGVVYRAVRDDDQYQKQVAIKVVQGGMDWSLVLGRFKAERQILANLEHPNIARLIDGGTTEEGCPYFSMEYVEGQTLDRYCASHQLSTRQRLELFRTICSAVHYAHQRLVIHRDLKPSNILVTEEGTPKLLDFGLAKLLSAEDCRVATLTGPPMMTPEYASPEQVLGSTLTTATDLYSLGMVLYELLAGKRAYELKTRALPESLEVVCKIEPVPPSRVAPREIARRLSGDLDDIVLMALRKEPARRYASVQELSEDIRRHLEGLPVLARGDAASYRAAKFVRRHKAAVAATALVGLSLLGGTVATARQARIAEANRELAERRFNDVRKLANEVFLSKYHDGITQYSTATRETLLNEAVEYVESLSPETLAMDSAYALAYAGLAQAYLREYNATKAPELIGQARNSAQRAVELNASLAPVHYAMGLIQMAAGEYELAIESFESSITIQPEPYTYRELANAYLSSNRPRQAEATFRREIEMHPTYWAGYRDLAVFYQDRGRFDEALPLFEKVVELTPDNYAGWANLGGLYLRLGMPAKADECFQRSISIRPTFASYYNLGTQFYLQKRYDEAIEMYKKAADLTPDPRAWAALGDVYRQVPQSADAMRDAYAHAIELIEKELLVKPGDGRNWARIATWRVVTDHENALNDIREALRLSPEDGFVQARAASVYEQSGMRDRALAAVKAAVELGFLPC